MSPPSKSAQNSGLRKSIGAFAPHGNATAPEYREKRFWRVPESPSLLSWRFDESAEPDYVDAIVYYEEQGIAERFEEDFRRAVNHIRAHPESGVVVTAEGARKWPLSVFRFCLYYTIEPNGIRIWAVAHDRRRPGYWRQRLE
jgi:plasmid stabilization system protein ParE